VGKGRPGLTYNPVIIFPIRMSESKRIARAVEVPLDHEPKGSSGLGNPPSIHVQAGLPSMKSSVGSIQSVDRNTRRIKEIRRVDRVPVMDQIRLDIPPKFHRPSALGNEQSIAIVFGKLVEIQTHTQRVGFRKSSSDKGSWAIDRSEVCVACHVRSAVAWESLIQKVAGKTA